jgi:hypothetical protein
MIVSGAGSIIAGAAFAGPSGPSTTGLSALARYSLGGAVWYLLTAIWLFGPARASSRLPRAGS